MKQFIAYNMTLLYRSLYTGKWDLMENLLYRALSTHKILFCRFYNRPISGRLSACSQRVKPMLDQITTIKPARSVLSP